MGRDDGTTDSVGSTEGPDSAVGEVVGVMESDGKELGAFD